MARWRAKELVLPPARPARGKATSCCASAPISHHHRHGLHRRLRSASFPVSHAAHCRNAQQRLHALNTPPTLSPFAFAITCFPQP